MEPPIRPRSRGASDTALPGVSPVLLRLFEGYAGWYLRRHFHALRLDTSGWMPATASDSIPTVVYLNHASWWDPLVCLLLRRALFPHHAAYAPIDAEAIRRYAFFRHLGFFGIEADSPRGAAMFLSVARAITERRSTMLWLTPQGRFADARERPIRLRPGLSHLAARLARANPRTSASVGPVRFLPLAIEYTFWEERLPEILVRFGDPLVVAADSLDASARSVSDWTTSLARRLEDSMDHLAETALRRDTQPLVHLLQGTRGVGGVYDVWRRWKSLLQGRTFQARHGNL